MAAQTATAATQAAAPPAPDLAALKTRQQAAWSSGNYAIVGSTLQIVGEELCEALDLKAGSKVLDVAAGNGMATPRRRAAVVRRHLDRLRAGAAGTRPGARGGGRHGKSNSGKPTPKTCRSTTTVSTRCSPPSASCSRRTRTARPPSCCGSASPKGQIGLANWTPEGFIGQVFKTLGKYLPPPAGAKSPALWGTRARLTEMFDAGARSIKAESRLFKFRYRSPEHFLDVFKTFYGPVLKAFAALDPAKQEELHNDLHALIVRMNRVRRRHHGRAQRISRGRHHQAVKRRGQKIPAGPFAWSRR